MSQRTPGASARRIACALALAAVWAAPAGLEGGESPLSPAVRAALEGPAPAGGHVVWAYFQDKGALSSERLREAQALISPRAQARRALRGRTGRAVTPEDLPVVTEYVAAVASRVSGVRHVSRWLNAVSVAANAAQIDAVAALPFVMHVDVVRRGRRPPAPVATASLARPSLQAPGVHLLDYGEGFDQVAQLQVPQVHDLGFSGAGVIVAVLDAGFDNLAHAAFAGMQILAARDFVNGDDDVGNGADAGEGSHGTATLSVIGGFQPGQLIGPAWGASYLLAKTENTTSETPLEEDHWAAAAEWAEALGTDVISTSLGYTSFDPPFVGYTPAQLDGQTAVSTRAADLAAARGVVVVSSAGNSGFSAEHNTLGAPADGHLVLAVGAVMASGTRSFFSSVGPTADGRIKPDVAARGTNVRVATGAFLWPPYTTSNGTSFSCPLVAGVAALVLQAHPEYSVDQVHAVLRTTASQATLPDNLLGWGIVNALAALQAEAPPVASTQPQ